jgi:hypothetical protein
MLHAAASILRRQISDITISDDKYLAHEEVQYQILVLSFLPLKLFINHSSSVCRICGK